jgi:hypothetical protein
MTYGSQRFYLPNKNTYEYIMCSCVTCDGETHRHTVLSKGWIIAATQLKVITVNDDRMIGYHINLYIYYYVFTITRNIIPTMIIHNIKPSHIIFMKK